MMHNHSVPIATVMAVAVPTWVNHRGPTREHGVMIGILLFTFFLDWITGITLAHRSPVVNKSSHVGIDAAIRDFVIIAICSSGILLDFVFQTKSFIFAFFTSAFIWQNFYSFLGNITVLGWAKNFPMWFFNFIQGEFIEKLNKYYPDGKNDKEKKK